MACPRDFACHLWVADWRALRPGLYPSSIEQKKRTPPPFVHISCKNDYHELHGNSIVGWRRPGTKSHKWASPGAPTQGFVQEITASARNYNKCGRRVLLQHHKACAGSNDMCQGKPVLGQKCSPKATLSQLCKEPQALNQQAHHQRMLFWACTTHRLENARNPWGIYQWIAHTVDKVACAYFLEGWATHRHLGLMPNVALQIDRYHCTNPSWDSRAEVAN